MSDLTVYAEALIATVARAFYDDEAVCLIDGMFVSLRLFQAII